MPGGGPSRNELEVLAQVGEEAGERGGGQTAWSHSREAEFHFRGSEKLLEGFRGFGNDTISYMFSKDPSSSCVRMDLEKGQRGLLGGSRSLQGRSEGGLTRGMAMVREVRGFGVYFGDNDYSSEEKEMN